MELLTLEDVMKETKQYFASGKGNPILESVMIKHMEIKKEVPPAVLTSLNLKPIQAYRRTK
jgi:hypothetical protein